MMQMKIFHDTNRKELERRVNTWLAENPIQIVTCQLTSVVVDQPDGYSVDCTIAVFFIPMQSIG